METSSSTSLAFRDTDPSHRFTPHQLALNSSRRARPPPMDLLCREDQENRVPLAPKKLDRRASKGGLRGMFTRTKGEEKSTVSPLKKENTPISATTAGARSPATSSQKAPRSATTVSSTLATPATPAVQGRHSRIALRSSSSKSLKESKHKNPEDRSIPKSIQAFPHAPTRASAAWDPPPLFQAYPQSIKHATLAASNLSADAILRMSNHKKISILRNEVAHVAEEDAMERNVTAKKAKTKHRRQLSGSKADWTQKIFVLVTSGYLLQYAGEGTFDRLPEKMLQLGTESVAFASDTIPGKHWVLQVSQALDANGSPSSDSRSLLSRLAFRGSDYRRTAISLLMVMDNAEDMESWLAVVRREIEALGGKKIVSETGRKSKTDEKVMQLRAQPSHRYLVQREAEHDLPSQSSSSNSERLSMSDSRQSEVEQDVRSQVHDNTTNSLNSATNSSDGRHLETLTDSTNRLSYMSSGQHTLVTLQSSSASTSPTRDSCSTVDDFLPMHSKEEHHLRPNAAAISERMKSMQTVPLPVIEAQSKSGHRPHSTYGTPSPQALTSSSELHDFSGPDSSMKRSPLTDKNLPQKSCGIDTLDSPNVIEATYESVKIRSKPLPRVFHKRHSFSSAIESRPISEIPSYPRMHSNESRVRSTLFDDLQSPRTSGATYGAFPAVGYTKSPRYSQRHSAMPRSIGKPGDPLAHHFTPPASYSGSSIMLDHSRRPSYIPIDREASEVPPVTFAKKLRRPVSMQIRSSPHEQQTTSMASSYMDGDHTSKLLPLLPTDSSLSNASGSPPHDRLDTSNPSVRRPRAEDDKIIEARKSMPLLVTGPPPAPPPDCALPPLPPPQKSPLPP